MNDERLRIERVYRERERSGPGRGLLGYEGFFHVCRVQERLYQTLRLFRRAGLTDLAALDILDVGCGEGSMLRQCLEWGADPARVAGIDIREQAVARAQALSPQVTVRLGSAEALPWDRDSFALVCLQTVLSSVLDAGRRLAIAQEVSRVLRPSGYVLWYDFFYNNPRNPDVVGLGAAEIRRLFPDFPPAVRRVTLAPPIARRLPEWSLPLSYQLLASIAPLRTHYLGLLRKP